MQYRYWAILLVAAAAMGTGYWFGLTAPSPPLRELATHAKIAPRKPSATSEQAADAITAGAISSHEKIAQQPAVASAPLPPIDTPLHKIYANLAARAQAGDAAAAMRLVDDLQRCEDRRGISRLMNTVANRMQSKTWTGQPGKGDFSARQIQSYTDYLQKLDALCSGITPDQVNERGQWLRRAALDGDSEAMVCYAAAPGYFGPKWLSDAWFEWIEQWRAEAPQMAATAFAAGQVDVLPLLQDAYSEGMPNIHMRMTQTQLGQLTLPDPTLAYAFALLVERAAPLNGLSYSQKIVDSTVAALTPAQIERARSYADAEWPRFIRQAGSTNIYVPCSKYIHGFYPKP